MMKTSRVAIFYKVVKPHPPHGHPNPYHVGGLAANGLHSVGVLQEMGVDATLVAVRDFVELTAWLSVKPIQDVVVVEAIWLTGQQVSALGKNYPTTKFVVRSHSKIGFLQIEPEAVPVMRDIIEISKKERNVFFSSNNEEFCRALAETYGHTLYLPNLYDFAASPKRKQTLLGPLRIASFGATRLLKLHPNAALAALQIARRFDMDLEFFINKDRTPGGESVRNTVRNLLRNDPYARLIEVEWQDSDAFKETIATMDLVFQLSATETFCLVAADAVASGVPVIVGPAISWVPKKYQVNIDNTSEAATAGLSAIEYDTATAREELKALKAFVSSAKDVWAKFLGIKKRKNSWF